MLGILGSRKTLCDGLTRRDFLHVGGLGALGLSLADFFRLQKAQAARRPRGGTPRGAAEPCAPASSPDRRPCRPPVRASMVTHL